MAAGGGPTAFENVFKQFAKHGDPKSKGDEITLANIDKWLKQANVMGKKLNASDTSSAFKVVAKNKNALTEKEFVEFLDAVTKGKGVSVKEVQDSLIASGPPNASPTNLPRAKLNSEQVGALDDWTHNDDGTECESCGKNRSASTAKNGSEANSDESFVMAEAEESDALNSLD